MMLKLLALLPLAIAQDVDKAKLEFKQAILTLHESSVRDAAERLARSDNREAAEALLEGYAITAGQLKQLWIEKVHWIREADANSNIEWINTPEGSMVAPGSQSRYIKLTEAQQKGKEVEGKIMRVEAVKRAIVQALAMLKSDTSVKQLTSRLKSDSAWDRRAGIAEALGLIDHPDALPALLDRMKSDSDAGVKVACLDAIRTKKPTATEVVAAVCDQLKSDYWQVKYTAATTLKTLGCKDSIEPLIETLKGLDGRLNHDLNDVLLALTGVDKHGDYAAWRSWFDTNKDSIAAAQPPLRSNDPATPGNGRGTTFYGIPIKSKNVIFILDCSGSMAWDSEWKDAPIDTPTGAGSDPYGKPDGNRKIDIARWQLKRCLAQLVEGTEFNIIFFSSAFEVMSEKMVKMNGATRKQAMAFADRLQPEGGTNIYDPLEKAFSFAGTGELRDKLGKGAIDTIFLLTDGMPNAGQIADTSAILAKLRDLNKLKKINVNTIGVFSTAPPMEQQANEKELGERFLNQMAQDHGGLFVNASKGDSGRSKKE